MVTAGYYRAQAKILLSWAAEMADPVIAQRLKQRAEDYLMLADELAASELPVPPERASQAPVPQQEQQHQQQQQSPPKTDGETD